MELGPSGVSAHLTRLTGLDEELADRLDSYRRHLQSQPLATHTRRAYAGRVGGYFSWLAETDPAWRRQQGDPFTDIHARDTPSATTATTCSPTDAPSRPR